MTRKRYCKLMMAKGVSRNTANYLAYEVKNAGSYNKLYIKTNLSTVTLSPAALADAFQRIVDNLKPAIQEACRSVADGLKRMAEGFRALSDG